MQKGQFFTYIDGLRGIAVLAVLAFHLRNSWLPSGFLGVDIFFVISGFVVSHSVHRFQGTLSHFLLEFYRRRVLRIFPPLLVCLILTSIVAALLIPEANNHVVFGRVSRGAHFAMSNFTLMKESANYFSPIADFHPLTHTWSLGIEEQFYVLFPFLFFFLFLNRKNTFFSGFAFFALGLLSLVAAVFTQDPTKAFYSFYPRIWELAFGVSAYLLSHQFVFGPDLKTAGKRLLNGAALGCLLVLLLSLFQEHAENAFSLWQLSAVLCTGTLLFLLRATESESFVSTRLLDIKPLRWAGKISYSLYLFHWPVIVIFRWTLGMESPTSLALAGFLSLGFGTLSFYFIEKPIKNFSHFGMRFRKGSVPLSSNQIIAGGLSAVAVSLLITSAIYHFQERISLSRTAVNAQDWSHGDIYLNSDCPVETKHLPSGAMLYSQSLTSTPCVVERGPRKLFVVGDSHASGYGVLFKKIVQNQFSEVQAFTFPGCSTFHMIFATTDCDKFIQRSLKSIAEVASPNDVLFLPGLRLWRLTDYHANPVASARVENLLTPEALASRESLKKSALQMMEPIFALKLKVVLEAPKPLFRISPYRCSDSFNKNNPMCRWGFEMNRKELLAYRKPILDALEEAVKEAPLMFVWDPFPVLCPQSEDDICRPFLGEKPLFSDYDHLTAFGNIAVYEDLVSTLNQLTSR